MKHAIAGVLFLTISLISSAQSFKPPVLQGRVNDYADILSPAAETQLNARLTELERTDSTQVVVLTVPSLQGLPIEEYSLETVENWKLGTGGNDNGALLLVAPGERKMRIEVGYGLEGVLTDIMAGRIIDTVIAPEFRLNRYDAGVLKGTEAIIAAVRGEYKGDGAGFSSGESSEGEQGFSLFPLLILFFVVSLFGSRRKVFGGISGAILLPLFAWILFPGALPFLLFLIPGGFILGLLLSFLRLIPFSGGGMYGRRRRHHHGGYGIFGGRSGGWGGFGGGGGGFSGRGGGFGGGGASGGW